MAFWLTIIPGLGNVTEGKRYLVWRKNVQDFSVFPNLDAPVDYPIPFDSDHLLRVYQYHKHPDIAKVAIEVEVIQKVKV